MYTALVRDPIVETSYKLHCAVLVNLLCDVYRLGPNKFWSQIYILGTSNFLNLKFVYSEKATKIGNKY